LSEGERLDLETMRDAVRYQRWIVDSFGPGLGGHVLEVGAGTGNITRLLPERAASVTAVEPDPDGVRELERLDLAGVEVVHAPIATYEPRGPFDCAVAVNVLEHIEDDIGALARIRSWLVPGGWVFLFVPAHPFLYGSLDVKAHHVRRYRPGTLRRALASAGFRGGWIKHMNALGAIGWLVAGRVLRVGHVSRTTVHLTENVVVPVGRTVERWMEPPFGQSLVAGAWGD
jgi:SAM-dependent methyltransferase